MIQRAVEDRRIKKIKPVKDKRSNFRRQEDKKNVIAYYGALMISFSIIVIFFTISLLQK